MLWDWLPWLGRKRIADRIAYFLTEMEEEPERHRVERERWLAGGIRRRQMYNEALRRLHAHGWGAGLERRPIDDPVAAGSRHWGSLAAAATAACFLLILVGWLTIGRPRIPEQPSASLQIAEQKEFKTLSRQRKTVKLADGSLVTLGPDTDLTASLNSDRRRLELRKGSARFSVAHDARRPFVVWAGGGTTTATGTVFEVSLRPDRTVHVDLIEGSIVVESPAVSGNRINSARKLTAGEHAIYSAASSAKLDGPQSEAGEHSIHFEYEHLDTVVARLNQHSPVVIELSDPSLAQLRVYGDCDLHDVVQFVQMIALSLNLDAVESPSHIVLRTKDGATEK